MARLSQKQREVLQFVSDCCKPDKDIETGETTVIPAYAPKLEIKFDNQSEMDRFLNNLEQRGFIRIDRRNFLYITEAGCAAIA